MTEKSYYNPVHPEHDPDTDNWWTAPEFWKGETVYIIGGGPSINQIDLSLIKDKNVIGINNAYQLGDWIDVMYFMDRPWYNDHKHDLCIFPNLKVTTLKHCRHIPMPNLKFLHGAYKGSPQEDRSYLSVKAHSGVAAINLAVLLGAKDIVLLGYDMKVDSEGNHNYHNEHTRNIQETTYRKRFIPALEEMVEPLADRGIQVFNASVDSALECWPKVYLDEYVRG